MKISTLSRQSGVSVATIKFYLREQLLPPGTPTARNQAEYNQDHLTRLKLIRVFTGIGMMSLACVREVLTAIDDKGLTAQGLARVITRALLADHTPEESEPDPRDSSQSRIDEFVDNVGWQVEPDAPARSTLAQVFTALQYLGWDGEAEVFELYASTAESLARREVVAAPPQESAAALVARTVLYEVAFAAMRRMAYEHHLALRAGNGPAPDPDEPAD
ncbi:MerR family transcriptional regulator [Micromonospora sp. NBC_01699]|uniref:MerR family transcriptional regulator n=1 Tax=Micromonospora sp. NBC_01699 TaxID=2975984 RepID=UPI002E37F800|nr:MerR family transcriptional regulator [Micromonospora sp. NBC_01699]